MMRKRLINTTTNSWAAVDERSIEIEQHGRDRHRLILTHGMNARFISAWQNANGPRPKPGPIAQTNA